MIAIIDYGSGNIGAIANIYKQLKIPYIITNDLKQLELAQKYILPGVGAFDATINHLKMAGITAVLDEQILVNKKNILGICVGMQILGDKSEEGDLPGLGWIPGKIRSIDIGSFASSPKLPHMGWNSIKAKNSVKIFKGVDLEHGFYFLHSYYFDADSAENVIAKVTYGNDIPCAVERENIFGLQFHPEKSHANGLAIFRNFAEL